MIIVTVGISEVTPLSTTWIDLWLTAEKYLRDHPIMFRIFSSDRTHSDSETNVSAVWHIKVET